MREHYGRECVCKRESVCEQEREEERESGSKLSGE